MAETLIEWTATRLPDGRVLPGYTFNPVVGCQKVGPGCDNCYAEGWAKRSGLVAWGPGADRRVTSEANWTKPLKWNREAESSGIRRNVFCASLADVMDNAWPQGVRARLGRLIVATPHLIWMLLTKRIGNAAAMLAEMFPGGIPPNVWLGISVVNQAEADRDIPKLLAIPVAVRFLSMEPLLGPVDVWEYLSGAHQVEENDWIARRLDWVIVGGESGPGARPMHFDWARSLRDQCAAAGVPFFFKQWGEFEPLGPTSSMLGLRGLFTEKWVQFDGYGFLRVGKKAAGRLLDGRTWDQMPGAAHA